MIIDILAGAVLLISAVIAFFRGFIREVLTIFGIGGGVAAAWFGAPLAAPYIGDLIGVHREEGKEQPRLFDVIPYDVVADVLAYGGIFVVVVVILSLISHFLSESVRSIGLGAVDRSLGVVFGLARGILLLGVLYLPVHLFIEGDTKARWFGGSRSHVYLEQVSALIGGFLPEEAVKGLEDTAAQADEALSTREKLEKINVLSPGDKPQPKPAQEPAPDGDAQGGYRPDVRQEMDRLFEEQTSPPPAAPPGGAR